MNRKMIRRLFPLLLLTALTGTALATHNRAGEITYERITNYYYKVTITTYTKTSAPADRPELDIFWGDGTSSTLPRNSYQDNFGGPGSDVRRNLYTGYHNYPGPSTYTIYFEDPNRNGGVVNIPNSVDVPFYVESQLVISAFLGFNNSPILLQPPLDEGTIGQVFIHNPNAYDPDGDSLAYQLIVCKGAGGLPIPGYTFPVASNSFTLDAVTGDLVWDSPVNCGEFNVAFLIKEYRNGVQIGYVERDMQIVIHCNNPNNNAPPSFAALKDTCVTAGDFLSFTVTATDPNPGNTVTLTATGAPLSLAVSPAQFTQGTVGSPTVSEVFEWQTDCDHVRRMPWQMVFKAKDNDPNVSLVSLEAVQITIVAPAPLNPIAAPTGNSIQLNWDQSICQNATGYKVYRRAGTYGFSPGPCETGVPAYTGYSLITTLTGIGSNAYLDNNNGTGLVPGTNYCYMVTAYFADGAESYASVEFCAYLKKERPVITNVSVTSTDAVNGIMDIAWSKPSDLDQVQYPPPYEYRIFRATGISGNLFTYVNSTFDLNDTLFTDNSLNTVADGYRYRIDLYATVSGSQQLVGSTEKASSIFLGISPTDEKLILSWNLSVPWPNDYYTVYRQNGAVWDSIGFSTTTSFTDTGLVNGQQYCYYVMSYGGYEGPGFTDPIINLSQQACAIPIDNVPPCPIATDTLAYDCPGRFIELSWDVPADTCGDDVASYQVYFSPTGKPPFLLMATINDPSTGSYEITDSVSVAGCYYVTATDSTGNESEPGAVICVDYCPLYELPNVFTPDGDGFNDEFHPFPYRFVESIDLNIFNRWGLLVFSTDDPDIMWNGKTDITGNDLPDGVYFYICQVNEIYLSGTRPRQLQGTIQLIREKTNFNK
jgi:gliding motility-associated-like protein